MHLHVYVLAKGENAGDAESNVRCFLDDQVGEGKWFDYGELDEDAKTLPLYVVRKQLQSGLEYVYNVELKRHLLIFDNNRKKMKEEGKPLFDSNTGALGYPAHCISMICHQEFHSEMPFYNREDCSWLLPEEKEDGLDSEGQAWYAVPVDLHF